MSAGVVHWALGSEVSMGPDRVGPLGGRGAKPSRRQREIPLPKGHSLHQHNHLPTVQVRIRDLDQWVTLIEHGGLTALDDTYVRALASRYGNPNDILRRDYVFGGCQASMRREPTMPTHANPGIYWMRWAESHRSGPATNSSSREQRRGK